jgi:hypothetical protein
MGTGPAIAATEPAYTGLIDTSKPWWKNRRLSFPIQNKVQLMQCTTVGLLALNVWIGLLWVYNESMATARLGLT